MKQPDDRELLVSVCTILAYRLQQTDPKAARAIANDLRQYVDACPSLGDIVCFMARGGVPPALPALENWIWQSIRAEASAPVLGGNA